MSHLAEGLEAREFKVSIIAPLPNYPRGKIFSGYRGQFKKTTIEQGMTIHRLWLYASNSKNKIKRLLSMLSFSFSLAWYSAFNKVPDTIIVQSPPLIVAFSAVLFFKSKKSKLILNVSDLWPLAGLELNAMRRNFWYSMLERIERYNYRKSDLILGQSEEIIHHIKSIYTDKDTQLYRNYPNFKPTINTEYTIPTHKIKLVYAGLLGVAQGVLKLCQNLDYSKIEFHIYGAGAEKEAIDYFLKNNQDLPIMFHGEVERADLHKILPAYDLAIIPLLNRIYGSVPSKIFEFSKLGIPLLYFGGGEGEALVKSFNLGWVAEAANYKALNSVISQIELGMLSNSRRDQIKETADNNFDFNSQLDTIVDFI
ncbi:MAG: glycosyltransferase family 4 protein [Bacteroidia bacterium]|nr:glycosyltransferase family 4 protein [Bacteroidia bacterium]NND51955.1 glycosyltransferase family 4 protein [Flavobacteriaceae bacterium]